MRFILEVCIWLIKFNKSFIKPANHVIWINDTKQYLYDLLNRESVGKIIKIMTVWHYVYYSINSDTTTLKIFFFSIDVRLFSRIYISIPGWMVHILKKNNTKTKRNKFLSNCISETACCTTFITINWNSALLPLCLMDRWLTKFGRHIPSKQYKFQLLLEIKIKFIFTAFKLRIKGHMGDLQFDENN